MLGIVLVHPRLERLERASQLVALFVPHRSAETLGPAGDPGGRSGRHLRREGCPRSALGGARERRLRRVEARGARDRRARGSARASDAPRTTPRLPTGAGRRRHGTCTQHVNTRVCSHQQIEGVRRVERVLTFRASSFSRPRAHDQARRVRAIALARARPSSRHHRARAFAPPRRRRAPRGHGERESSGAEEIRGGEVEPTVER